jgi:1,4-dihydroxy-2-naphthoate octaprenyltransferase
VWALLGLVSVLTIYRATQVVMGGAEARRLVPVLGSTGRYELAYAVAVLAGVLISRALA